MDKEVRLEDTPAMIVDRALKDYGMGVDKYCQNFMSSYELLLLRCDLMRRQNESDKENVEEQTTDDS